MATMTPREQIEWIRDDVMSLCETRMRMPKLVYLLSVTDHNALVDSMCSVSGVRPHTAEGRIWIWVGSWAVEIIADADKPAGLAPSRCYRCPCGEMFLDDTSRSGKCVGCQTERVVAEVHRCPTEEHARRALAESVSRDTSAVFDFDRMIDEHYPRDENGRHYIPAPPKVDWSKLTKTKVPPYKLGPFRFESREQFVDAMKADARASTATVMLPDERPDGFAQSRIDEIKAMLTAPVKGKR